MAKLGGLAKGCGLFVAGVVALIGVLVIALLAWLHFVGPPKPLPEPKTPAERTARNLKIFDAAWGDINRHYYDRTFQGLDWAGVRRELRPKAASAVNTAGLYNILWKMTATLHDSHTSVSPEDETGSGVVLKPEPSTCGHPPGQTDPGFQLGQALDGSGFVVADVRKGSPADRAGLEPGSRVVRENLAFPSCGPARVDLDLPPSGLGPARRVTFLAEYASSEPSHAAVTLADGVQVLRFNRFDLADGAWLLARLTSAPAAGVILDLRHNNGGPIIVLELIAGVLEGPGRPLGTAMDARGRHPLRSRRPNPLDRMAMNDFKTPSSFQYRGPLVVLVGPASASAAEILARSLHLNGRALLVGERTSGAVLAGQRYYLPDGGVIQVAVQDFEDPLRQRLEERGVAPDIFARQTLAAIRSDRDLVVDAADGAIPRARLMAMHN